MNVITSFLHRMHTTCLHSSSATTTGKSAKGKSRLAAIVMGAGLSLFAALPQAAVAADFGVTNFVSNPTIIPRHGEAELSVEVSRFEGSGPVTVTLPMPTLVELVAPLPSNCIASGTAGVDEVLTCQVNPSVNEIAVKQTWKVKGRATGAETKSATVPADDNNGNNSQSMAVTVVTGGDLQISKVAHPTGSAAPVGYSTPLEVAGGALLSYTLRPIIASGDDLPNTATLRVVDHLPDASVFEYINTNGTGAGWTCNVSAGVLTCDLAGPRAVGSLPEIRVNGRVMKDGTGDFDNIAELKPQPPNSTHYQDSNPLTFDTGNIKVNVIPGADLESGISFPLNVPTGETQNIVVEMHNNGPSSVTGGRLRTVIPDGFVFDPANLGGCTVVGPGSLGSAPNQTSGTLVECVSGTLSTGGNASWTIPVTTPNAPSSDVRLYAQTFPPVGIVDPVPGNDLSSTATNIELPYADLGITKTKTPALVLAGQEMVSTITVTNHGIKPAIYSAGTGSTPLRIVETMSNDEEFVGVATADAGDWTCSGGADNSGGAGLRRVICVRNAAGELVVGASITLRLTTRAAATLTNLSPALVNTACTGSTALTMLGLTPNDGPQPPDPISGDSADCSNGSAGVTNRAALVDIVKHVSKTAAGPWNTAAADTVLLATERDVFFRIQVTNRAGSTHTVPTLNVQDQIRNYLTVNSVSTKIVKAEVVTPGTGESCTSGSTIACTLKDVAPGQTREIQIHIQRPFASGDNILNRTTVTSPDAILLEGSVLTADAYYRAASVADVEVVEKKATPDIIRTNQTATFTILTRNNGPDAAANVVMRDAIDKSKYEVLTAVWGASNTPCDIDRSDATNDVVSCNYTSALNRNAVFTSTITVRPKKLAGATYPDSTGTNTASVTTTTCEMTMAEIEAGTGTCSLVLADNAALDNNQKTATFVVNAPEVDTLVKKVSVEPFVAFGDELLFRIRAQNAGPSRAEGIVLEDILSPASGYNMTFAAVRDINAVAAESGFSLDASKVGTVSCQQTAANAPVTCNLHATADSNYLDATKEVNFVMAFTVAGTPPARSISFGNTIEIRPDEFANYEPQTGNNKQDANITVLPSTDLAVRKETITAGPVDIAQPVEFRITVTNNGTSTASRIRTVDTLPTGFEWIHSNNAQGDYRPKVAALAGSTLTGSNILGMGTAPGHGTDGCFVSSGTTPTRTVPQVITCDFSGEFAPGTGNDVATVTLFARAIPELYNGQPGAEFGVNRTNGVRVQPGLNNEGSPVSRDTVDTNNEGSSVVQVHNTSIGGRVFVDLNNNGDQDGTIASADQGIGNVTLRLTGTDKYGNPVDRTVTTSDVPAGTGSLRGDYLFDNLAPSDSAGYTITQTQPTGYVNGDPQPNVIRTIRNVPSTGVSNKGAASNPDANSSVISGIVINGGGRGIQFDFPEQTTDATAPVLKISGYVYVDANNDGNFVPGERPLPGVIMTLIGCAAGPDNTVNTALVGTSQPTVCSGDDEPVSLTATTDAAGFYTFPLSQPGVYTVIQQPTQPVVDGVTTLRGKTTAGTVELVGGTVGGGTRGTVNTTNNPVGGAPGVSSEVTNGIPSSIRNIVISDSTAQSVNNNFGEVLPGSISGFVYTEKGTPGSNYDPTTDWPFAGVTVTLTGKDDLGNDVTVSPTTTNPDGSYNFDGLRPSGPAGYVVTKTNPSRPDPVQNENPGSYPGTETGGVTGSVPGTRSTADIVTGVLLVSGSNITQTNFAVLNGTRVELALAKRHIGDVIVGQQATYELTITNKGDSPTFGSIQLADTLPPGMSLIATNPITSTMGTVSTPVVTGQTVRFDFTPTTPIPVANGVAIVLVHVDVAELAQGNAVINYATVTGGGDPYVPPGTPGPGCTDQHCDQDEVRVYGPPVLSLAKTGPATLVLGNTDVYTLTITNSGEAATIGTLKLIEHLPPGLDLNPNTVLDSDDGTIANVVTTGDVATGLIVNFDFDPHTPLAATNGTAAVKVPVLITVDTPIGVTTNYASVGGGGDLGGNPPTPGSACTERRCANVPANVEGGGLLSIEKRANKSEAELGDMVTYTLVIRNMSQATVVRPNIIDRMPQGFRLIDDTSRVTGATLLQMTGAPGPVVTYSLDLIAPGDKVTITYRVRLGVGSMQGDGVNRASAECPLNPNTKCSNEARWRVKVSGGVFTDDACIVGMVYVDCNGNQIKDNEELGIPGVRLYASNGLFLISDSEGKYSYCGFSPKTHVLKVDQTTMPRGSRLVVSSNRNVGDANSLFLDLKKGELQRADFIEGSCSNTVLEQVKARRTQGEVSAPHVEKKGGVGFSFEGKAPNYPQQGTDSANQVIVKPRMDSKQDIEKAVPAETVSERDTPVRQLEINQGGRDAR